MTTEFDTNDFDPESNHVRERYVLDKVDEEVERIERTYKGTASEELQLERTFSPNSVFCKHVARVLDIAPKVLTALSPAARAEREAAVAKVAAQVTEHLGSRGRTIEASIEARAAAQAADEAEVALRRAEQQHAGLVRLCRHDDDRVLLAKSLVESRRKALDDARARLARGTGRAA